MDNTKRELAPEDLEKVMGGFSSDDTVQVGTCTNCGLPVAAPFWYGFGECPHCQGNGGDVPFRFPLPPFPVRKRPCGFDMLPS